MGAFRQNLMSHRWLALWLVGLALALKAIVPGGYMVGQQGKVFTVTICGDASATSLVRQIVIPQQQTTKDIHEKQVKSAPCLYSALDMAGAAGGSAIWLAQGVAFIIASGFAPLIAPEPRQVLHLRPPLRGPPNPV